ncbi:hypothetical protein OCK74_26555 [Chitinophagaceae bacterium LB-8]|uniref:DUF3185 domain-containing protein n=1 Tax=Paraflavisolibacter caeni TaxID=2982496 RepID=A0A9X2XZV3_9BACT|nr:hypothetical protein [Paraflavisolibacter caeni]MCU7552709.1 hypothetical protein [Paraflavisolibacter caeni]
MQTLKIAGVALVLLGIVMIAIGGFSYKQKKKVLDTGVIDITAKETKTITWPPIVGGIVVLGGVVVYILGGKNR